MNLTRNVVLGYLCILVAVVLSLTYAVHEHDVRVKETALWQEHDSVRSVAISRLQHTADSLEKAYRIDTVRLTKTQTKYETLAGRIDSLYLHDTVRVPVEVVRELKHDADSTIKACTAVRLDCESRVRILTAQRDSFAASAKANLGLARPGFGQRVYVIGRDYVILRALEAAVTAAVRK